MAQHYAVFSDVHAIHPALEQVIFELAQLPTPHIPIFLGDVVGYGPQPRQTTLTLFQYMQAHPHALALLGNHDALMLGLSNFGRGNSNDSTDDPIAQLARQHGATLQGDEDIMEWLRGLTPQAILPGHKDILIAHDEFIVHTQDLSIRKWGYPTKDSKAVKAQLRNLNRYSKMNFRALFVGHRHTPALYQYDSEQRNVITYEPTASVHVFEDVGPGNPVIVNVGSIALPRDGAQATYVLLTIDDASNKLTVEFRHVSYPTETPLYGLSQATYPEALRAKVSSWIKSI